MLLRGNTNTRHFTAHTHQKTIIKKKQTENVERNIHQFISIRRKNTNTRKHHNEATQMYKITINNTIKSTRKQEQETLSIKYSSQVTHSWSLISVHCMISLFRYNQLTSLCHIHSLLIKISVSALKANTKCQIEALIHNQLSLKIRVLMAAGCVCCCCFCVLSLV